MPQSPLDSSGFLPPRRKGNLAFTLVEVIIAIVITSILAMLLYSGIGKMTASSNAATCMANMRTYGSALMLFRTDHNGWFPPGYPVRASKFKPEEIVPGMPAQPGMQNSVMNKLVPDYLAEPLFCPGIKFTDEGRRRFPDKKKRMVQLNGSYGIQGILLQVKMESLSSTLVGWPTNTQTFPWDASREPFILEVGAGVTTWAFTHQQQALNGIPQYETLGRSHSGDDGLFFMFLDGHIKLIRRNDQRDVEESAKSWLAPTNPNGEFRAWGEGGKYHHLRQISDDKFKLIYPHYFPPPED